MMEGRNAYRDFVGKLKGKKPPSLLFHGYQGVSLGVKQLEHEAAHSPPSIAEVKNKHYCTSSPPYNVECKVLLEVLDVNHRVKEFPFYAPQRFITVFSEACHWTIFSITKI